MDKLFGTYKAYKNILIEEVTPTLQQHHLLNVFEVKILRA